MSVPTITKMEVVPVAGYDSMLLNLSGAHGPYFTRNIVVLTDSEGNEASAKCQVVKKSPAPLKLSSH